MLRHPDVPVMISALRKSGMIQEDIGSEVGLSQNFISDLERGNKVSIQFGPGLKLLDLYAGRCLGLELRLVPARPARRKAAPKRGRAARRCA
jgi:transcriptional regulator with XRE-family HTH domain